MNALIQNLTILMIAVALFPSCKKNDDQAPSTGIHNTIKQGTWKVSLFQEDSTVETSNFSGYSFQFISDGSASTTNGTNTVPGTWSAWTDSGTSKLAINFGSATPFEELNEDWEVLEENASVIRLKHTSGGNGGVDYLNFEKI